MNGHLHRTIWGACVLLFLNLAAALPAAAQFSVNGVRVEKGEWEVEVHGSVQNGLPSFEEDEANEFGAFNQIRQGHELEVGYGLTDFWQIELGLTVQKPVRDDFQASAIEIQNTVELDTFERWNTTVSFFAAVSFDLTGDEADVVEFGPLVQFGDEKSVGLILNALFGKTFGPNRDEGVGFEYIGQFRFAVTEWVSLGVEAFGEIDNIQHMGDFEDTELRVGPMVYFDFGGDDDDNGKGEGKGKRNGKTKSLKDDDDKGLEDDGPEFELGLGVLVGATDATPDLTFKWDLEISF